MGYYTDFTVSADTNDEHVVDKINKALYDFDISLFDSSNLKWYEWKEDMKAISLKFPGILFEIQGEGEESGDMWWAKVIDGKCSIAEAVITKGEWSAFE